MPPATSAAAPDAPHPAELRMRLACVRLTPSAYLPRRGSAGAAGYDLSACLLEPDGAPRGGFSKGEHALMPGARALVPTGLVLTVPPDTYGRIAPRSGLAVKHGIDTLAGVIDRVRQTILQVMGFRAATC